MDLRIMTFNLRRSVVTDFGNAWPRRVARAAQAIGRAGAWVVGTQEGLARMLHQLGDHLPGYGWVGEGRKGGNRSEHCAIFYQREKVSVRDWGQFYLSATCDLPGSKSWGTACPRVCTWARFAPSEEPQREFLVFNTHLDHWSQRAREESIQLIWRKMAEIRGNTELPTILLGDFNAGPGNPVIKFLRSLPSLKDAFKETGIEDREIGTTFHAFTGLRRGLPIDYLFGLGAMEFRRIEVDRERIDGRFPSDHYPVLADIELK